MSKEELPAELRAKGIVDIAFDADREPRVDVLHNPSFQEHLAYLKAMDNLPAQPETTP